MDESSLDDIAGQLSDLEVAILLCLAAHEHCLIETTADCIQDLAKELALVSSRFSLQKKFVSDLLIRLPHIHLIYLTPSSTVRRQHLSRISATRF